MLDESDGTYQLVCTYDYDGLNQLVVEDHKDHQQSTASSTKVYQYDTHGNRTAVHQYAYEGRPTISIPTSYYTNFNLYFFVDLIH